MYKQFFRATKSSLEQQLTAVSNLIFVENEKIELRWAQTRITLRKNKKVIIRK